MEQTSARAWDQEKPSGSSPLRLQLDQLTQKQDTFAFADSRECNGFSVVHYTSSSSVLLLTIMELRKAHRTGDRLSRRVAEIPHNQSILIETVATLPRIES